MGIYLLAVSGGCVADGIGHRVTRCLPLPPATVAQVTDESGSTATEDDSVSADKIDSRNYSSAQVDVSMTGAVPMAAIGQGRALR